MFFRFWMMRKAKDQHLSRQLENVGERLAKLYLAGNCGSSARFSFETDAHSSA